MLTKRILFIYNSVVNKKTFIYNRIVVLYLLITKIDCTFNLDKCLLWLRLRSGTKRVIIYALNYFIFLKIQNAGILFDSSQGDLEFCIKTKIKTVQNVYQIQTAE